MGLPILQPGTLSPGLSDKEFRDRLKEFLHVTHLTLREDQEQGFCGGLAACRKYSDALDAVLQDHGSWQCWRSAHPSPSPLPQRRG